MSRDEGILLKELRQALEKIVQYSHGLSKIDHFVDEMRLDAIIRNLIVIGEVAKVLSEETKARIAGVEWNKIIGFRNIVVHEYFDIDVEILDDVVFRKVPILLAVLHEVK